MLIDERQGQPASDSAEINGRLRSPAVRVSAASGVIWALIACYIGYRIFGYRIWGGIILAPLIGVLIGRLSRPLHDKPRSVQIAGSLFYLYVAASCFALGMGLVSAVFRPRHMTLSGALIEPVWAVLWGLTFSAYVAVLWALSFFNHRLVWHAHTGRIPGPPQVRTAIPAVRTLAVRIMALSAWGYVAWTLVLAVFGTVGSPAATRPWWAATGLMGWSTWFVVGLFVWLSAPLLSFGAALAAGSEEGPAATYPELIGLAGLAIIAFPIYFLAASLLVTTIKVSLVYSWATEGRVFWASSYYRNVFHGYLRWFLVGGGMILARRLLRPCR